MVLPVYKGKGIQWMCIIRITDQATVLDRIGISVTATL